MIKKYSKIGSIIFPSKKINIFVLFILFLGVIYGAIFSQIVNLNDKQLVIDKIMLFISNINNNSVNSFILFKNSILINFMYVFIIWILGMTLIGIIFVILLVFLKGFIFGFTLASFFLVYSYKGLILSLLYLLFGQLLNIFVIAILSIYSIMFTLKLFKLIFKHTDNVIIVFLKNYVLIFVISIIISIISSLCETFILPALIRLIIKLFI